MSSDSTSPITIESVMIVAKLILRMERSAREAGELPAVQIRSLQDMAMAIAGEHADEMLQMMAEAGLDMSTEFPDPITVPIEYFEL